MVLLLFERLLSMGDWIGGGSEHNSERWNFAIIKMRQRTVLKCIWQENCETRVDYTTLVEL